MILVSVEWRANRTIEGREISSAARPLERGTGNLTGRRSGAVGERSVGRVVSECYYSRLEISKRSFCGYPGRRDRSWRNCQGSTE
jgi:hypothetical protein